MRRSLALFASFVSATDARAELYIELPNGRWLCIPNGLLLLAAFILAAAIVAYIIWYLAENWGSEQRWTPTRRPTTTGEYERETTHLSEFSRRLDAEAARDEERLRAALQQETLNFEELFRRFEEDSAHRRGR